MILALGGIGAMAAAIVMGNRETPKRHITFMYGVWTLSTLAVTGYGLASFPWQAMVACFVFNALEGAGTIVWATTKGRLVPQRLLGRVSSLDWFISIGLVPVSYAVTGPVAALFGARTTLVGAGIVGGIVTFAFLFLPGMRDVERSGDLARATSGTGSSEVPLLPPGAGVLDGEHHEPATVSAASESPS
jgi:hypothetical protein